MKKSKIKQIVHNAMKIYYETGYTNTANKVRNKIYQDLDKLFNQK